MTLPPFNFSQALVDRDGYATKPVRDWMIAMQALATSTATLAANAVPATRNVVASGGLHVGGSLSDDVGLTLYRGLLPVVSLPTGGNAQGDLAYALDGRKVGEGAGAGTGVPVWWSGTGWFAIDSGAVVTA